MAIIHQQHIAKVRLFLKQLVGYHTPATDSHGYTVFETSWWLSDTTTHSQGSIVLETIALLSNTFNNSRGCTVSETIAWQQIARAGLFLKQLGGYQTPATIARAALFLNNWVAITYQQHKARAGLFLKQLGGYQIPSTHSQGWTVFETTGWLSDTSNHLLKETEFEISCSGTVCLMVDLFCLCNLFVNLRRQPMSMCVCSKSGANKWQNTERQNFWISIERTYTVLISFSVSCQNTTFYLWT